MLKNKVYIIDYGLGNLYSVLRAIQYLDFNVEIIDQPNNLLGASHVILPGVGAFSKGMEELIKYDWIESINTYIQSGKPFLGICLGMQLLFESSIEGGHVSGLGLIPGKVLKIPLEGKNYKVPHVGWNKLIFSERFNYKKIMNGIQSEECSMYFVHSYHVHAQEQNVISTCDYFGNSITALVQKDNILGCQFHPEKSGKHGLIFLKNFIQTLSFNSREFIHTKSY